MWYWLQRTLDTAFRQSPRWHDGPGVCLGDGQTAAEWVPSQGGRGDALLRRMSPYLT